MVNFDPNISQSSPAAGNIGPRPKAGSAAGAAGADFGKAAGKVSDYISQVSGQQQSADVSIMDLLSGKNEDINTVVAEVAKADMSFKVLVGVRNKLIEAYKQTMNMPI